MPVRSLGYTRLPALALLLATGFGSPAGAHPHVDDRRDALLEEMARRLGDWQVQRRAPPARSPREAPAPADLPADEGLAAGAWIDVDDPWDRTDEVAEHAADAVVESDDAPATCAAEPEAFARIPAPESPARPAPDWVEPEITAPREPRRPLPMKPVVPPSADDGASPLDQAVARGYHDAALAAEAVLAATNAARAAHGLGPVTSHAVLRAAAEEYGEHMAREGFFGHFDRTRPHMLKPSHRVAAAGGVDAVPAENLITETWLQVADGEQMWVIDAERVLYSRTPDGEPIPPHTYRTLAKSMVDRWMDSPGHRRNLLDPHAVHMDFGMGWMGEGGLPTVVGVQLFQRFHPLGTRPDSRSAR